MLENGLKSRLGCIWLGSQADGSVHPNQSTDVDPDETGKQNARLFGNHENTNKMSESSIDWSGTNVEWKNRVIDEVRTICGRKDFGQKNVSESVR
jgi:hypothetical protein